MPSRPAHQMRWDPRPFLSTRRHDLHALLTTPFIPRLESMPLKIGVEIFYPRMWSAPPLDPELRARPLKYTGAEHG